MKIFNIHKHLLFVYVVLLLGSPASMAADTPSEEVKGIVSQNVAELLKIFETEKGFYETDPDRFYKNMDSALNKIVDFRRIAAKVMGRYARMANKEQRDRFVAVFKDSLYSTYTKTLIDSGTFDIKVTRALINSRNSGRATVDIEVISDNGSVYPVTYSMYLNKEDEWLLENVIVFGVNIGLAFRDRFETQMRANKNNVDAVIEGWQVDLDVKQIQGES